MSLTPISSQFGQGGANLTDGVLKDAIQELQSLKTVVVAGAAATTNIAIAGIKTTDTLKSAIAFTAGVPSDVKGTTTITSAGNIQNSGDTSGKTLIVEYYVKP